MTTFSLLEGSLAEAEVDAIVVGMYADSALTGPAAEIDRATEGLLTRLVSSEDIRGKACESTVILAPHGLRTTRLLVLGLGTRDKLDVGGAFQAGGTAARMLSERERGEVVFAFGADWSEECTEAAAAGIVVGCQGQDLYRQEKKRFPLGKTQWLGSRAAALDAGQVLGESINVARRLVNEPPQEMFPSAFAAAATQIAAEIGLEIEVWDETQLQQQRCGALLAVARGSAKPPRLVIVKHHGADSSQPTLALVGKGVTFDSGGLSLKPSDGMKTMKCDMAGAATVLAAMRAIAQLKLPVNAIGVMGLAENMVGPDSYKLGDVLTARNGRTIEVHNTDAEGRLVLADALSVAVEQGAAKMIDLATLTGACVVALGNDVAGLMTNDSTWCDVIAAAAKHCGEPAWELPMFEEYGQQIRSEVADLKNVGEGRWGGAITAAKFLEEFVAKVPWTHIDIAGPAFLEKPKPWLDAGASGVMVRTLVEVARRWSSSK